MAQKYYRTVIEVEVLSAGPDDPEDLEQVHHDIGEGDCSGKWRITASEDVTADRLADLLEAQGSEPGFLLDPDGEEANDAPDGDPPAIEPATIAVTRYRRCAFLDLGTWRQGRQRSAGLEDVHRGPAFWAMPPAGVAGDWPEKVKWLDPVMMQGNTMLKPGDRVTYQGHTRTVTDDYGPKFYPRYALDDGSLVSEEDVQPAQGGTPSAANAVPGEGNPPKGR
jgi:hypothetical protein